MEAKGVFTLELLPTCCTAERPLLRVYRHVTSHLDHRPAGLVTMLTLQQLLRFLVAQEVVFKRRFDSECFLTLIAGEWLWFFCPLVKLEVILKRLLFSVRSFAPSTREGQRGVTQKVIFQRLLFEETSATLVTRKRLLVVPHVFLQFTFPMKTGVTMLTGVMLHCLHLFSCKLSFQHST